MPFIGTSFEEDGIRTNITGDISMVMSVSEVSASSIYRIPAFGRSTSAFETKTATGSSTSLSVTFSVLPTDTQYSNRLVVFVIGAYMSSGSGSISSVTYGGSPCTRVIGSYSSSDKGNCEIWKITLPTNPASNILSVTCNKTVSKLAVAREVLLGLTSTLAVDGNVQKKDSDDAIQFNLDHPANGITILGSVLWWGGSSAANCGWPIGGATKSSQLFSATGNEFGFSSAYYVNASADTNRSFGNLWTGPGSPNNEMVGACWA